MGRIYLSPSTQEANQYVGGTTGYTDSEEYWCRKVANLVEDYLRSAGHTVRVGGSASAGANAADSNAWKANWHIAIHTNAGGGEGSEGWAYPGSVKGAALAKAVYGPVAKVSNAPDRGVKYSAKYIELNATNAPATIIEIIFHDDKSDAAEMRADWRAFAKAIAIGILEVAGGSLPAVVPPVQPPVQPEPPVVSVKSWKILSQDADTITLQKL